ncbi:MAG: phosphate uptake regulator PhoU [Nitrososphaerota archaeon]|nr:phosphate uptake regulator PhoU [Candidatus Calditenuaceae archaeon]MDW8073828.1 phosphate uptake regulator PhoU [Nitrososphaerota archaeon]
MALYPRRLQRLGTTTLVVSLPKQWAAERRLKPGDVVYIEVNGDRLTIYSREVAQEPTAAIISADEVEKPEILARIVASCFLQGHDIVKVTSNLGLTESQTQAILATVEWLPGFEVVEQTPRQIVLQAIIDPTKFKIEAVIRRLNVLVISMMGVAVDTLVRGVSEKVGEVLDTGKKLEELYHMAVRQLIIALKNPSVAHSVGIDSPIAVLGYRLVAKAIEEAGQHAISLAKESLHVRHKGITIKKSIVNKLVSIAEEVQTLFTNSVNAFLTLDLKMVNSVLDSLQGMMDTIETTERELIEEVDDAELSLSLRVSLMHFSAILDAVKTISEVALNKFVRMSTNIVQVATASQ